MYKLKSIVCDFTVDGEDYYTFANYDETKSEASNIDNALAYVSKAIFGKGIVEAHAANGERAFVNLAENGTCTLKGAKVVSLTSE